MDGFLVGRLLMRFWALKTFQASNEVVIFDRSDRGRPRLLLNNDAKTWTFNVSHAGDYTVFVAQSKYVPCGRLYKPRLVYFLSPFSLYCRAVSLCTKKGNSSIGALKSTVYNR
jgi:hypothetical protein